MDKQPMFGVPRIVVRRHRALVGALVAVGLCAGIVAGIVYSGLSPSMSSATATVWVDNPSPSALSSSVPPPAVAQAPVATTMPVLTEAGRSVSPPVSATTLAKRVKVVVVGPQVMSFRVTAPSAADAVRLANALTSAYIRYVSATDTGRALQIHVIDQATVATSRSSPFFSPIDAVGGLVAGLAIGSVVLWKDRREWRGVQLI
jgi:hypothetical protein